MGNSTIKTKYWNYVKTGIFYLIAGILVVYILGTDGQCGNPSRAMLVQFRPVP